MAPNPIYPRHLHWWRDVCNDEGVALGLELSRLRREELVKPEANVHSILSRWFSSPGWGGARNLSTGKGTYILIALTGAVCYPLHICIHARHKGELYEGTSGSRLADSVSGRRAGARTGAARPGGAEAVSGPPHCQHRPEIQE